MTNLEISLTITLLISSVALFVAVMVARAMMESADDYRNAYYKAQAALLRVNERPLFPKSVNKTRKEMGLPVLITPEMFTVKTPEPSPVERSIQQLIKQQDEGLEAYLREACQTLGLTLDELNERFVLEIDTKMPNTTGFDFNVDRNDYTMWITQRYRLRPRML